MPTLSTGTAASTARAAVSTTPLPCPESPARPDAAAIVYVVDDDPSVRESLGSLIRSAGWQPKTFESAPDFLSSPHPPSPCCLVLDVRLPVLSGLELQKHLGARADMPIIFITGNADVPATVQAMKAGAVEFLTKPFNGDVLLNAIAGAIERSRAALRLDAEMRAAKDAYASLSPRQRDVMALVVSGLLNKQIAGELGITEWTVKAHRGWVMRKMNVDSLADLVTIAAKLRLAYPRKSRRLQIARRAPGSTDGSWEADAND